MDVPTPRTIYCPRCGAPVRMEKVADTPTNAKLKESGYAAGARGNCGCGVTAILAIKRMPANPTFTLMFNIYKIEDKEKR